MTLFLPSYPEWHRDASCRTIGGDLWHPEPGDTGQDAKRICMGCPVRDECLSYAMETDEQEGIWGGFTPRERRRLKRGEEVVPYIKERKKAAVKCCHFCGGEFFSNHGLAKYCSPRCSNRALHEREREKRAAKAAELDTGSAA